MIINCILQYLSYRMATGECDFARTGINITQATYEGLWTSLQERVACFRWYKNNCLMLGKNNVAIVFIWKLNRSWKQTKKGYEKARLTKHILWWLCTLWTEPKWNYVSKNSLPCRVPGLHWPQAVFCIRSGRQEWRSSHVLTSWRNLQSRWWTLSPDLIAWLASERQHSDHGSSSSCQISPVHFPKAWARCECSSVTKGSSFSCRSPRNEGWG